MKKKTTKDGSSVVFYNKNIKHKNIIKWSWVVIFFLAKEKKNQGWEKLHDNDVLLVSDQFFQENNKLNVFGW